jgi:hypothetical protein
MRTVAIVGTAFFTYKNSEFFFMLFIHMGSWDSLVGVVTVLEPGASGALGFNPGRAKGVSSSPENVQTALRPVRFFSVDKVAGAQSLPQIPPRRLYIITHFGYHDT